MRTIVFICIVALSMSVCAQQSKEEILKVGEHLYKKCYFYDLLSVNRISKDTVPFNQDSWKEYYDVHSVGAEPKDILVKYASPYIKEGKADIHLIIIHSLQGELIYTEYVYSQEYDVIPIEVFDKIDEEMKVRVKISVKQRRKDIERDIHSIPMDIFVTVGKETPEKDNYQ